jgi:hypothetical protein
VSGGDEGATFGPGVGARSCAPPLASMSLSFGGVSRWGLVYSWGLACRTYALLINRHEL